MPASAQRPDPDELLSRVAEVEARKNRARLKIFLGFAPGVGKTYAMLGLAAKMQAESRDVLLGVVETHGRDETAARLHGLPALSRRTQEYRGVTLGEFDLDAALRRKPEVLFLDELAHTNAPGSRHAKRWQDVLELLDAGINVVTTLNVQHVESLNDVVAQITGVVVRETVPDHVLARADELELIDVAPEVLLQRLQDGKVYLGEQGARAAQNFFRLGNLLALRELALRATASHVEKDVVTYRREHGIDETWAAAETVLVCIGPSPASSRLARTAYRIAQGLHATLVAVSVSTPSRPWSAAESERVDTHMRLVETLGGSVVRLTGESTADALIAYAREHNVTRIVIGKPTHTRWKDRLRGSLLDEVVRASGDIDVHVVRGDDASVQHPPPKKSESGSVRHYAYAGLAVVLATGLGELLGTLLDLPDIVMLYLLSIVAIAGAWGRGPSLFAAGLSVALLDFFFVPPRFTFAVSDTRHLLTFAVMFGVSLGMSSLMSRLRYQQNAASARERVTGELYAYVRDLSDAQSAADVARVTTEHVSRTLRAQVLVLVPHDVDGLTVSPPTVSHSMSPDDLGVARWAFEHAQPAGWRTATLNGARWLCVPLQSGSRRPVGILAVHASADAKRWGVEDEQLLASFCRQAALGIERVEFQQVAHTASLRAQAEEARSSLLSVVSHDLRTPLATITGVATTLLDSASQLPEHERKELLQAMCVEAERLERLVTNLLNMVRLDAEGLPLQTDWLSIEETIGSALLKLESKLQGRVVRTNLADDVPLVRGDAVLLEHVFLNLIENAIKYSPANEPIDIGATVHNGALRVTVEDRGPGISPEDARRVFDKFFRSASAPVGGVGLGLAICRAIVRLHGGEIGVSARDGGGSTFAFTIPIEPAPSVPEERDSGVP